MNTFKLQAEIEEIDKEMSRRIKLILNAKFKKMGILFTAICFTSVAEHPQSFNKEFPHQSRALRLIGYDQNGSLKFRDIVCEAFFTFKVIERKNLLDQDDDCGESNNYEDYWVELLEFTAVE